MNDGFAFGDAKGFGDMRCWPVLQTFTHGSLHDLLRDQLAIELTRVRTKISARRAQAKESKLLEIPNMAPLLCVRGSVRWRVGRAAGRVASHG
ncbi:UTRA domain-containing protein [Klebsiella aerogenes]|uniref:UTRA domain-containing protein n=1 Tax=Klebsiella aerogenes TaxID=548 RepID=UPI003877AEC0